MGVRVFHYCTSLKKVTYNAIRCHEGWEVDGTYYVLFRKCPINKITIGNNVEYVPMYLFVDLDTTFTVINIIIPNSVKKIGEFAFTQCHSLTSIIIPENVDTIGAFAFSHCTSLKKVIYNAINCEAWNSPFAYCPVSSVTFGSNVDSIPDYLFSNFGSTFTFTSVTIPENVKSMGNGVFHACSNLASVTYNATNCAASWKFGTYYPPFTGCPLSSVTFGDNVDSIPDYLFYDEDSTFTFTSVTIPENVKSMGKSVFYGCKHLATVTYNATNCVADWIDGNTYYLPFRDCPLSSITFGSKVDSIPAGLFWDGGNTFTFTTINLPTNLKKIGEVAFRNCKKITGTIAIPASVTEIGQRVFVLHVVYYRQNKTLCSIFVGNIR